MQRNSYKIVSYKVKHVHDELIKEFLRDYRYILQRSIDIIWDNITWKRKGKRLIPLLPKSQEFKKQLRQQLSKNWKHAAHYVVAAVEVAYSILSSWRRNYLKGYRCRKKPVVKRKFVRVKKTLYTVKDGKIRITIIPRELYVEIDISNVWFKKRVKNMELGELILKENEVILTYRSKVDDQQLDGNSNTIAWDLNLFSMDGFCDKGWIRVDLKYLYTLHCTYENKRRRIQKLMKKKPKTAKRLLKKYSRRRNNRIKDFLHKLTRTLCKEFPEYAHCFEDLDKIKMPRTTSKKFNRVVSNMNFKEIIKLMSYKSRVVLVDPKFTTQTCSRCGGRMKHRKGQVLKCEKCGLVINRQLNAAINLYLKMWGFPPSMKTWKETILPVLRRREVTLNGGETDDILPMNSEGVEVDVPQGPCVSIRVHMG